MNVNDMGLKELRLAVQTLRPYAAGAWSDQAKLAGRAATIRRLRAEIDSVNEIAGCPADQSLVDYVRELQGKVERLEIVAGWAQAVLNALNTGDIASGSPLHRKLREIMIQYREAAEAAGEE